MAGARPHLRERPAAARAHRRRQAARRPRAHPASACTSLDWLIDVQTSDAGGSRRSAATGAGRAAGRAARFDQQPIEATALILAAEVALAQTGEPRYLDAIERAYGWFLGDNDVGLAVADPVDGRLLRRARAGRREPQPGRRVDADVADRAGARPRDPSRRERRADQRRRRLGRRSRPSRPAEGDAHGRRRCRTCSSAIRCNPIITADQLPYRANSVFNPGAARVGDETVLLHARRGPARHLASRWSRGAATASRTGGSTPRRCSRPSRTTTPRRSGAARIPRLTWLPEREEWAIAYTAYSRRGPLVSLAMTRDFTEVRRLGPVDAARGQGRRAVPAPVRRPLGDDPPTLAAARRRAHVDLVLARPAHWGDHELLLEARDGAWWDAGKIGLGPPPLETAGRLAALLPRRPHDRGRADLPDRPGAARPRRPARSCCAGPTSGCSARRRRTSAAATSTRSSSRPAGCTTPQTEHAVDVLRRRRQPSSPSRRRACDDLLDYMAHAPRPEQRRSDDHVGSW